MGIAKNSAIKIRDFFVPVDFMVLDMQPDSKVSPILERPFLSTANAHIDVGAREIGFNINRIEERFAFKPRLELNLMVNMVWQEEEDYHLRDWMVHPKNKQWRSPVWWT
jgi:hypothetical protein